jgi:hypothetical protein
VVGIPDRCSYASAVALGAGEGDTLGLTSGLGASEVAKVRTGVARGDGAVEGAGSCVVQEAMSTATTEIDAKKRVGRLGIMARRYIPHRTHHKPAEVLT